MKSSKCKLGLKLETKSNLRRQIIRRNPENLCNPGSIKFKLKKVPWIRRYKPHLSIIKMVEARTHCYPKYFPFSFLLWRRIAAVATRRLRKYNPHLKVSLHSVWSCFSNAAAFLKSNFTNSFSTLLPNPSPISKTRFLRNKKS